jgi:hypothetical protein
MAKAKIGFEIDEHDLANAKAFVAKHGGSLNKLVSALFASLGREETERSPMIDPAKRVLMSVSTGNISIMEAARLLDMPDAGFVLSRLSELGLPLPRLPEEAVRQQLNSARSALEQCLLEPGPDRKKKSRLTDRPTVA